MSTVTTRFVTAALAALATMQAGALPTPASAPAASRMQPLFNLQWWMNSALVPYNGQLYGVNAYCSSGNGCVFRVDPATGLETEVYNFSGGADGLAPIGGMVAVGNYLYGTTFMGGNSGNGVVFRLDPAAGTVKVLHSFDAPTDGQSPWGRLAYHNGAVYGTTEYGGLLGNGSFFKVDLSTGAETLLHGFNPQTEGGEPVAGVTFVGDTLYGTTSSGGAGNNGSVFSFNLKSNLFEVMHVFNTVDNNGNDGASPNSDLTLVNGQLYGTTGLGFGASRYGMLFRFDPASGTETLVHAFGAAGDGHYPLYSAPLYVKGYLYGVTYQGGTQGDGTLYRVNLTSGQEDVIYAFTGGADGAEPQANLLNYQGYLWGSAGATVFRYSLGPNP